MKESDKGKVSFDENGNIIKMNEKVKIVVLKKDYDRLTLDDQKHFKRAKGTMKMKKDPDGVWEVQEGGNWDKVDKDVLAQINEFFLEDWYVNQIDDDIFANDEVEFMLKLSPSKIIIKAKETTKEEDISNVKETDYLKMKERINTERQGGSYISFKTKSGGKFKREFHPSK